MPLPLLQTKLYIPPPRLHLVSRPSVTARLHAGLFRPLTLIAAPAGFGKTTLVSKWIYELRESLVDEQTFVNQKSEIANPQVAWLSLDDDDNDPTRFLTYLIAALQTQQPQLGVSAQELLGAPQAPPPKGVLTLVLNELATLTTPLVLVLDDYHLIMTPAIHEALVFLIDRLPPSCHLVITSRMDPPLPLARWRVRNQLAELRVNDLRFDSAEVATFLNEVMGLTLTVAEIATLEARTEGWIAGLQLAALSMQGRSDVASFIQAFSGSHRHVLSYLVEEVLNRCPPDVLDFLLQTAILDQMSAGLCEAVTGRPASQELLETLERGNLFLISLDDLRQWYRYHHLFAEVLRVRLQQTQPERIPQLHQRASAWYAAAGQLEQAVSHALAANDHAQAASLIEPVALTTLLQQSEVLLMHRLLERLPLADICAHPRLLLAYGLALMLSGRFEAAETLLAQAGPALADRDLAGEIAGGLTLLYSTIARLRGNLEETILLGERALAQLPPDALLLRTGALLNVGVAYLKQGQTAVANQILAAAIALANEIGAEYLALVALEELATDQARRGQLRQTKTTCEQAFARAARWRGQHVPAVGLAYINLGKVLVEWNQGEQAIQILTQGIHLLRGAAEPHILVRGYSALARQHWANGDHATAFATLEQGEAWLTQIQVVAPIGHAWLAAQQARLHLRQGNWAAAQHWEQTIQPQGESPLSYLQQLTRVRLRLAQHIHEPRKNFLLEAGELLAQLLAMAEHKGWFSHVIEILVLRALIEQAQGQHIAAQNTLLRALGLAEPEGYLLLFVDEGEAMRRLMDACSVQIVEPRQRVYLERVLLAFGKPMAPPTKRNADETAALTPLPQAKRQNMVEPLSDREQEVLHLVATGLSNSQIAARLIVTTGTVKSHINHIFGKLTVESRTQAVARGRELGLLTD